MRNISWFRGFAILLFGILSPLYANAEWMSISEVKASTPIRWIEEYETEWRDISIDVQIDIPDSETMPILKVSRMHPVDDDKLFGLLKVSVNKNGVLTLISKEGKLSLNGNNEYYKSTHEFTDSELPNERPTNVLLNVEEAIRVILDSVYTLTSFKDFELNKGILRDQIWKFKTINGQRHYTTPVSNTGDYWFEFDQLFYGVKYRACNECYEDYAKSAGAQIWPNSTYVAGSVWGRESFRYTAILLKIDEIVCADIPVLSFDDAKSEIEKEILAGRLRSIEEIGLVYAPYLDPNDKECILLYPVWYVRGGYTRNPRQEFEAQYNKDGSLRNDGIERAEVVFECQTGKLMKYSDRSSSRRYAPRVITWGEIKK